MLIRHPIIGTVAYMGGVMAVPEPFNWAFANLVDYTRDALCKIETDERGRVIVQEHIHVDRAKQSLHPAARNELVGRMEGDWILMLDTDMDFRPDLAARMVSTMERFGVEVLCGMYSYKKPPHAPVLYQYNAESGHYDVLVEWDPAAEVFEIGSCGAGCLLVKRRVFQQIVVELKENAFDLMKKGEDHSFFERCRRVGIKVYCAARVEPAHLDFVGISTSRDFDPSGLAVSYTHESKAVRLAAP